MRHVSQSLQRRDVKIFMLANQLPLLQSGLEPAVNAAASSSNRQPRLVRL
jgi:hypothetical protein